MIVSSLVSPRAWVRGINRVGKGALKICKNGSWSLYQVQTLSGDGFEKFTKALIANLKLASRLQLCGRVHELVTALEAQRALYVATKLFGGIADCFRLEGDEGYRSFRLPRYDHSLDFSRIFYLCAGYAETAQFMLKHKLASFETFFRVADRLGSFKFGWERQMAMRDVPLIGYFLTKPKEFFVIGATFIDLKRMAVPFWEASWEERMDQCNIDFLLKCVGNMGRLGLIYYSKLYHHTVPFAWFDACVQNAGLVKFLMDRSKRQEQAARYSVRGR